MQNSYAVSTCGAAIDHCARWEAWELNQETDRRVKAHSDPRYNAKHEDPAALMQHYAREVQLQLQRLTGSDTTKAAILAWARVIMHARHQGRHGVDGLVVEAVQATAKVYPRARLMLPK